MNVMGAIKGNTLEVNWSIQRFMEEIKIILADIYIYIYIFWILFSESIWTQL